MHNNLPLQIKNIVGVMQCQQEKIGRSGASVYKYHDSEKTYYLKIDKPNNEFKREIEAMQWLDGKLPVPKIVLECIHNKHQYLLMSKVNGEMACSNNNLIDPEKTIKKLAEGLKMLWQVDISACPFDETLDIKLRNAKYNIDNNLVDMDDFEKGNSFESSKKMYEYLVKNRPNVKFVFSHGDYCLPNIFIDDNGISGFIDLGRAGKADIWNDIAICVRSLEYNFNTKEYTPLLFNYLGVKPDSDKINYYTLLDELF